MSDSVTPATPATGSPRVASPPWGVAPSGAGPISTPMLQSLEVLMKRLEQPDVKGMRDAVLEAGLKAVGDAVRQPNGLLSALFEHRVASLIQDAERSPLGRLNLSPDLRAEVERVAARPAPRGAAPNPQESPTPIRQALDVYNERMRQPDARAMKDAGLEADAQILRGLAKQPGGQNSAEFQHRVAWLIQDVERSPLGRLNLTPESRAEVERLGTSAPGLTNPRLKEMLSATPGLADPDLIRAIRETSLEEGRKPGHPGMASRIDDLENKVRLATRPAEPPGPTNAASQEATPATPGATANATPAGAQAAKAAAPANTTPFVPPPGSIFMNESPLAGVFRALRGVGGPPGGDGAPPWQPPATPMAARFATHEDRMLVEKAEQTGRAALDAIAAFGATTAGSVVMGRIQTAARSNADGIEGVLSGMREGGRYADLRREFNAALTTDNKAAAAHDRAVRAIDSYGKQRADLDPVIARRPDPVGTAEHFRSLDENIGRAAARTPDREDGKALMDRLGDVVGNIVRRAMAVVSSAFNRGATAEAGPRAAPSPGP